MAGRLTERSAPTEGLPGPGDYEQPQSALLGGGPAFSFTGRSGSEQELTRPPSPGPGERVGGGGEPSNWVIRGLVRKSSSAACLYISVPTYSQEGVAEVGSAACCLNISLPPSPHRRLPPRGSCGIRRPGVHPPRQTAGRQRGGIPRCRSRRIQPGEDAAVGTGLHHEAQDKRRGRHGGGRCARSVWTEGGRGSGLHHEAQDKRRRRHGGRRARSVWGGGRGSEPSLHISALEEAPRRPRVSGAKGVVGRRT